jgi:1-phosphofructokinase family hexose kinase
LTFDVLFLEGAALRYRMILTVTPNTALDHVYEVQHYVPGARLNAFAEAECIGGKGNLASAFAVDFGACSVSLGFAAGENGRRLAQLLRKRGVRTDLSLVRGETRRIMVVVDQKRHGQTWLLPETLRVARAHERDLEERLARWLPKSSWLALCGSLPPGCSPLVYRRFTKLAHACRVPVLIDSRGRSLALALAASPEVVKLNRDELQATFGEPISTELALAMALRRLLAEGVDLAVCTLGAQGAIAMTSGTGWRILAPAIQMVSSAGSGDAFTAALLAWRERGAEWPEALRWACATGTAKALEARTDRLDMDTARRLFRRVRVKNL